MQHLPVDNYSHARITQGFGKNRAYYSQFCHSGQCAEGHFGIDIGGDYAEDIYCVESGSVVEAGWSEGWGYFVRVNCYPVGEQWIYAHLSKIIVEGGETVHAGERIGLMGSTGTSTGVHLHLGMRHLHYTGAVVNWHNGYFGYVDFEDEMKKLAKKGGFDD